MQAGNSEGTLTAYRSDHQVFQNHSHPLHALGHAGLVRCYAAQLRICYHQAEPFAWNPDAWDTTESAVALDERIADLPALIEVEVQHRALSDNVVRKKLGSGRYVIRLAASLRTACCTWGDVPLLGATNMFGTLSDLFADPLIVPSAIEVTVTMQLERRYRPTEGLRSAFYWQNELPKYQYFRLGNVPIPEDHPRNDIRNLPWRREGRESGKKAEIKYIWALLAWRDPSNDRWQLSRVHAYEFEDFCVGDCDEWTMWNKVKFDSWHDYALLYQAVARQGEDYHQLQARLQEHIESGKPEPGSGVPILPSYTYNLYRPEAYGLGLQRWPKRDIDVAVRCVNHFAYTTELRQVAFPRNILLEIEEEDTQGDIKSIIGRLMNQRGRQNGITVNSALLFERPYVGEWAIELWTMPQFPGPQKLFRFREGKLTAFLSTSPKIRKGDKRLYMEAHIVPKQRG